jgi:hypothetical protein
MCGSRAHRGSDDFEDAVGERRGALPAQSESPDASPVMLVDERKQGPGVMYAASLWLPDLTGRSIVATRLRSHRDC